MFANEKKNSVPITRRREAFGVVGRGRRSCRVSVVTNKSILQLVSHPAEILLLRRLQVTWMCLIYNSERSRLGVAVHTIYGRNTVVDMIA